MAVGRHALGRGVADFVRQLDARQGVVEPEAAAVEDRFITFGVKVGEAFGKFDLLAPHRDAPERPLSLGLAMIGKVIGVYRKEPANSGGAEAQGPARDVRSEE